MVKEAGDFSVHLSDPEAQIAWSDIVQVVSLGRCLIYRFLVVCVMCLGARANFRAIFTPR